MYLYIYRPYFIYLFLLGGFTIFSASGPTVIPPLFFFVVTSPFHPHPQDQRPFSFFPLHPCGVGLPSPLPAPSPPRFADGEAFRQFSENRIKQNIMNNNKGLVAVTYRQTDRQTDRQTHSLTHSLKPRHELCVSS